MQFQGSLEGGEWMDQDRAVGPDHPAYDGQAAYTPLGLWAYDFATYRITVPMCWRCSKADLLDLYAKHASARHIDVGVASGSLLDECRFPSSSPEITLMDLNENSLDHAARRISRYSPRKHQGNVLEDWGLSSERFDSIAMMNILHCVPGTMKEKAVAFDHASAVLAPNGVLFGSTILGKGVRQTLPSKIAMPILNRRGVFSNREDSLEDLDAALAARFSEHEVTVRGVMALFVARGAN